MEIKLNKIFAGAVQGVTIINIFLFFKLIFKFINHKKRSRFTKGVFIFSIIVAAPSLILEFFLILSLYFNNYYNFSSDFMEFCANMLLLLSPMLQSIISAVNYSIQTDQFQDNLKNK